MVAVGETPPAWEVRLDAESRALRRSYSAQPPAALLNELLAIVAALAILCCWFYRQRPCWENINLKN